jgi:hypothetical protein
MIDGMPLLGREIKTLGEERVGLEEQALAGASPLVLEGLIAVLLVAVVLVLVVVAVVSL